MPHSHPCTLNCWTLLNSPLYHCHLKLNYSNLKSKSKSHCDWRSVSKSWCQAPSGAHDQIFITVWQLRLVLVKRPLWREDRSVFCICNWPLPAQSFSSHSPLGLATIFYCLRFENSLFVASYDSQGHGGGIRPRLHGPHRKQSLYCCRDSIESQSRDSHIANQLARWLLPSNEL
jgi:hypothetical protein